MHRGNQTAIEKPPKDLEGLEYSFHRGSDADEQKNHKRIAHNSVILKSASAHIKIPLHEREIAGD
jgi:hypothetical protein